MMGKLFNTLAALFAFTMFALSHLLWHDLEDTLFWATLAIIFEVRSLDE